MLKGNFKIRLKEMPLAGKAVFFGSLLMIISALLPWYRDIDKFKIGEIYLGITGPLYLAGLLVLLAGAVSFAWTFLIFTERKPLELPIKDMYLHMALGFFSILMLVLAVSVFFHPKFGTNLTDKSMGIGLISGFLSSSIVVLGAYLGLKQNAGFDVLARHEESLENFGAGERKSARLDNLTVGELEERAAVGVKPLQDSAYKAYHDMLTTKRTEGDLHLRNSNDVRNNCE